MCRVYIEMVVCKQCKAVYGSYRARVDECGAVGTALCKETVAQKKEVPGDECCSANCEEAYKTAARAKKYAETGVWPGVDMKSGRKK